MFTLPATPIQLLNSKLIVAYIWESLNTLIWIGSIFALSFSSGYYSAVHGDATPKSAFLSGFSSAITGGATDSVSFAEVFGYSLPTFIILGIVVLLIGNFFSLAMGYLAIALGQLVKKHKLGCSIGFYIALYVVVQIISSIAIIGINLPAITNDSLSLLEFSNNVYRTLLPCSAVLSLILGILFYIITVFIMRKKVNLD